MHVSGQRKASAERFPPLNVWTSVTMPAPDTGTIRRIPMTKLHVAAALLAFGSLAALPVCTSPSYSSAPPVQAAANPELSPGMVRQVQTALQQQGVYNGAIDGIWGPQTQAAVQSFQQ